MGKKICKYCGAELSKKDKRCWNCEEKVKKPLYKRFWFWILVIALLGSCGKKDEEPLKENDGFGSSQEATVSVDVEKEPEKPEKEEEPEEEYEYIPIIVEEEEPTVDDALTFELIAGETGDYGEPYTANKGTEFEENYIVYHVPAGTYTVTNTGEYMGQFNVYSEELRVNDAGYEEPAEVFYSLVLDVDTSDTVTIEDGQIIEIHEPDRFTLTAIELSEEEQVETASVETQPAVEETPIVEEPIVEESELEDPFAGMDDPVLEDPFAGMDDPVLENPFAGMDNPTIEVPSYDEPIEDEPVYEEPVEITVYITDTGSKYHVGSCRHLSESKIPISLSDAQTLGYTACGTCH